MPPKGQHVYDDGLGPSRDLRFWHTSFDPRLLHPDTDPVVILNDHRGLVAEAALEFGQLFPKLKLIPHALTMMCDLPLWNVERALKFLGVPFEEEYLLRKVASKARAKNYRKQARRKKSAAW